MGLRWNGIKFLVMKNTCHSFPDKPIGYKNLIFITLFLMSKAKDHSRTWKRRIKGLIRTHPDCQVRMWWGLLGGVAPISLDGVELLWL